MKKYNPDKHKRRSIRLKGYDYSREGLYFITICCQNRAHYFGEIINEEMQLNEIGEIAQKCWRDIPNHFKNVLLHTFVVMPNHIHGIIEIVTPVGANQHLPYNETVNQHLPHNETANYHLPDDNRAKDISPLRGTSNTIGSIVRGFKIGVTKWVRSNTNIHQIWQRNYYEHIIRNEASYFRIHEYIENNPAKWTEDCFHK
ncbi:transposase [Bergeyella zoohelcum]|uniref:transposase n=1 Tax=Bergeyella zoohelcum TaxID=1015 RepID=UPI002A9184C5|nr:transposase [Bergeyella zoohelcum]MDY6024928.1 transposase [Bergeyella zoohelcum]